MKEIRNEMTADLEGAGSTQEVEQVRIRYLGRKGRITTLAKEGVSHIMLGKSAVLTPLGRDKARQLNISVEREKL